MPTITLNKKYLMKILGKELTDKEIEDRFPMLGMGIENMNKDEVTVEIIHYKNYGY